MAKLINHYNNFNGIQEPRKLNLESELSNINLSDPFTKSALDILQKIVGEAKSGKKGNDDISDFNTKALIDLCTNRFGVKVKIAYNDQEEIYGIPHLFNTNSKLVSMATKVTNNKNFTNGFAKGILNKAGEAIENIVVGVKEQFNSLMFNVASKMTGVEMKELWEGNFHVDSTNLKISNAPKNAYWYITMDVASMCKDTSLEEAKKLLSLFLFSLGYCYHMYHTAYLTTSKLQVLGTTVKEDYGSKNKTVKETINNYYKRSGIKGSATEEDNLGYAILDSIKSTLKSVVSNSTDGATAFANKLGISGTKESFSNAYNAASKKNLSEQEELLNILEVLMLVFLLIYVLGMLAGNASLVYVGALYYLYILLIYLVCSIVYAVSGGGKDKDDDDEEDYFAKARRKFMSALQGVTDKEVKLNGSKSVELFDSILSKSDTADYKIAKSNITKENGIAEYFNNVFTLAASK